MSYYLGDAPLEQYTGSWRPGWTGDRKLVTVADLEEDPSQFVAYGTDGSYSFRLLGSKDVDLGAFLALMLLEDTEILSKPPDYLPSSSGPTPLNVIIKPPTIPSAESVQLAFDTELGGTSIAA